MSDVNNQMVEKYRNNFLKEVEANVEEGDWVKMCMQCGVCAGSCPMGPYWDHRCPRELPITHIMHGLAHYARRLGIAPKGQPTLKFSQLFWDNLMTDGRVNELKLGIRLYFIDGFVQGVKNALAASGLGLGMFKSKRLNPMEIIGGHKIKDKSGFQAMIRKAQEIEDARISGNSAGNSTGK